MDKLRRFGLTCSRQRLGWSWSFVTDSRYLDSSGETVRRDPKSTYSFAHIFALIRSETRDSRSKVTLENVPSGFSDAKVSLPAATLFVRSAISFEAASSTTLGCDVDWLLGRCSPTAGETLRVPMPADCKAPEIALDINSLSAVGLNCGVDVVLLGRDANSPSDRRCFADFAVVELFAAWRLEARLGGMLMKNWNCITQTYIRLKRCEAQN